jgi:hypothetical protein
LQKPWPKIATEASPSSSRRWEKKKPNCCPDVNKLGSCRARNRTSRISMNQWTPVSH